MPLVTISSIAVPSWQGNTTGIYLYVYNNASFTAESGTYYPKTEWMNLPHGGSSSLGTFYQSFPCTVSGTTLTIPQLQLDSTSDSPDNPGATYSAVLWDGTTTQPIQSWGTSAAQFGVSPTPTSTTWTEVLEGFAGVPLGTMTVGGVVTLAPGQPAYATITGTNPYFLNLQIPQGPQGIQGLQGIQGVQGPVGPPATYAGTWNDNSTYQEGQSVYRAGSAYVCLTANNIGNDPLTDTTDWGLLAAGGSVELLEQVVFTAAGTQTITHNLGSLRPVFRVYPQNGSSRYAITPINANSMSMQAWAPGSFEVAFTTISGGTQVAQTIPIPTSGLVEYWPCNETSTVVANNLVTTGNRFTLTGAARNNVAGFASGSTLTFDGQHTSTEGAIAAIVNSASNFNVLNQAFSISFWFEATSVFSYPNQSFMVTNGVINMLNIAGGLKVQMVGTTGGIGINVPGFIPSGLVNIVATYNGSGHASGVSVYYNNIQQTNLGFDSDNLTAAAPATSPWLLCPPSGGNPAICAIPGYISGIAIYNRALSAADVTTIYSVGAP